MIRIAIADDHEIVRNGLSMVIESEEKMKVLIQASSYAELIKHLKEIQVDILILDLNLGDLNGLVCLENVIALYPSLPILVLSAYPEEVYALRAFKSGASGYLNKAVVSSELICAIRTIIEGSKYTSTSFSDTLEYGTCLEKEETELTDILSKREFEVFSLIASGKTPTQIAEILTLSPKTVSTYRTRIMDKLMLENTSQLSRFAYEMLNFSS